MKGRDDVTEKQSGRQVQRRLYECDDCHERRFVAWVELCRAAKPKCYKCGSTKLELVSDEAKADRASLQQQRIEGTGGSLKLAGGLENPHRKVC
jgi:hypothetical protein